ncbi:MAG: hypothetical protein JW807_07220 [Spirochaetes bacterium]|nr:hypothetical protein [Spirochaetota bacterium]
MSRLCATVIFFAGIVCFQNYTPEAAETGRITLHFFTSGVCPACVRAERELPAMLKKYPRISLAKYEVRDSMNRVTPAHRRNVSALVSMLSAISGRLGGRPFIYEGRTAHAFAAVNGVPYYIKKISDTLSVKKEVPIPVFIMGDRAYLGYRPEDIRRALVLFNGGK